MNGRVCRESEGVHIPGCYGCAEYGHYACTCITPDETVREVLQRAVDVLERVQESLPRGTYPRTRQLVDDVLREAREVME